MSRNSTKIKSMMRKNEIQGQTFVQVNYNKSLLPSHSSTVMATNCLLGALFFLKLKSRKSEK